MIVERAACPAQHVCVSFLGRIGERFRGLGVASVTTDIFGRSWVVICSLVKSGLCSVAERLIPRWVRDARVA
jgi:hypothetical protein